jgi:hypothetical protein
MSKENYDFIKKAIEQLIAEHEDEAVEHLGSGKSAMSFIARHKEELTKLLLPDKFLITIELRAPPNATIASAIDMLKHTLMAATVVHIEKMEKES